MAGLPWYAVICVTVLALAAMAFTLGVVAILGWIVVSMFRDL